VKRTVERQVRQQPPQSRSIDDGESTQRGDHVEAGVDQRDGDEDRQGGTAEVVEQPDQIERKSERCHKVGQH
jgi:hypothetical protein